MRPIRSSLTPVGAVVVALVVLAGAASAAPLAFTSAVPLQMPAGGTGMNFEIHDSLSMTAGVAGFSYFTSISGATRWTPNGSPSLLDDLPGTISSYGYGINDSGRVVGRASLQGLQLDRSVRWAPDGSPTRLGDLPGQTTTFSEAYTINNAGQAVGQIGVSGLNYSRAVLWQSNGEATLLGSVPGHETRTSKAHDINDAGQAAGYVRRSVGVPSRAVRWEVNGSGTLLGDVPNETTTTSQANGINASGQAVGSAVFTSSNAGTRAVRWEADGSATRLGEVPGVPMYSTEAFGITDTGLTIGYTNVVAVPNNYLVATIWDEDGNAALLQDLMAEGNTWTFVTARGIDSDATTLRVLAFGSKNGGALNWYLVSATIPEPTAAGMLVLVVAPLLRQRSEPGRR